MLYTGAHGLVAHECILDLRGITKDTGVTVDDVAKRLIDYGFHAPTMSFPVAGTLMVEPTESEDLARARPVRRRDDRDQGRDRPGRGGGVAGEPTTRCATRRTPRRVLAGDVGHPYSRAEAAFPAGVDPAAKYWPPVRRIDGAFGDRNLVCACPPVAEYA